MVQISVRFKEKNLNGTEAIKLTDLYYELNLIKINI